MSAADRNRVAACLVALASILASAHARAQDAVSAGPQAAAEALFVEAKQLLDAGDYARACAKLAESQRLDPAAGTLMNLADCYEKNGQLASAWVTFREAMTAAQRDGRASWSDQAAARAQLLEPRLPTLTIALDPRRTPPGVEVTRDGAPVAASAWNSAIPVDPANSRIEVRAPGRKTWATTALVDGDHPHVVVDVPELELIPAKVPPAPPSQPQAVVLTEERHRSWQRPAGIALFGAGVIAAGVGTVFGVRAISKNDQAASLCPASPRCTDPDAVGLTNDAKSAATASTVSFVAGGALLAAGAYLFFTAPTQPAQAIRPTIAVGRGAWSAALEGRF